jgi:hypothetical protein
MHMPRRRITCLFLFTFAGCVGTMKSEQPSDCPDCQVGQHCDSTALTCVCDNRCTAAGPICDPSGSGQIGTCTLDETTGCYAITDLAACPVPAETCSAGAFACVGPSELMGWELDETNTGLKGDYSNLTELSDFTGIGYLGSELGPLYITANNITISNRQINYMTIVQGTGVVIDKCLIRPISGGGGMPNVMLSNTIIQDSELDASLIPAENVFAGISASGGCRIYRCNIHHMSTGVQIYNESSTTTVVEGNYIHGLRYVSPAHIDGLTIRRAEGPSTIIRNNRIIAAASAVTGAFFIQAQAYIDNVLIEGNLLEGDGYNFCLDYNAAGYGNHMQVINNRFNLYDYDGGIGFGEAYIAGGPGLYAWSDNYDYDADGEDGKGTMISMPTPQ